MYGVLFDSDRQFDRVAVCQMQIVNFYMIVYIAIVNEYAMSGYGDLFENSELCGSDRPVLGSVFSAPAAEVARRGESGHFDVVDEYGDV